VLAFDRIFYFFEESMREEARLRWTELKDRSEVERRYWRQDPAGRWAKGP
jgi:DNA polymerase-3 subunit chi